MTDASDKSANDEPANEDGANVGARIKGGRGFQYSAAKSRPVCR